MYSFGHFPLILTENPIMVGNLRRFIDIRTQFNNLIPNQNLIWELKHSDANEPLIA